MDILNKNRACSPTLACLEKEALPRWKSDARCAVCCCRREHFLLFSTVMNIFLIVLKRFLLQLVVWCMVIAITYVAAHFLPLFGVVFLFR